MPHAAFDGPGEKGVIGIGKDQVGALAAQFQRHPFQRFRRRLGNCPTGAGRSGEGNHLHIRMAGQLAADARPIAVDQIEHTGGQTGIVAELGKDHRVERRFLGRFQHAGAARQQRRDHLQRQLVHRPVPGGDQADNANRLQRDAVIGGMGAEGADPFQCVKGGQEVVRVPRQAGALLVAGHVDRRAHFHGDGAAEVFLAGLVLLQNPHHGGAAVGRRGGGPHRKGGPGGSDGGIGVGLPAQRNHRADLLSRGVDHRAIARGGGGGPATVDVEIAAGEHGGLLWDAGRIAPRLPRFNPSRCRI